MGLLSMTGKQEKSQNKINKLTPEFYQGMRSSNPDFFSPFDPGSSSPIPR